DRVRTGHENDRNGSGCGFGCQRGGWGGRKDYAYRVSHQLGGQCRQSIEATTRRAIFDCDVAAFDIAGVLETLPDLSDPLIIQIDAGQQANQRHGLLRARRERPSRRAAKQRDELAARHSITSSARASRVGGMVSPIALAVLRLITSSNLID